MSSVLRMPERPTLKQKAGAPKRTLVEGTYTFAHVAIWFLLGLLAGGIVGVIVGVAQ